MKGKAKKKKIIWFTASFLILIVSFLLEEKQIKEELELIFKPQQQNTSTYMQSEEWHTVIKVADGDTFTIESGEKIRLIGVDTPESVHPDKSKNTEFGKVVSGFAKEQLLDRKVRLEFDVTKTDKYNRVLAYVYLEDGTFYNELLLQKGYARVMTVQPNVAKQEVFLREESKAKDAGIGIWEDYKNIFL